MDSISKPLVDCPKTEHKTLKETKSLAPQTKEPNADEFEFENTHKAKHRNRLRKKQFS